MSHLDATLRRQEELSLQLLGARYGELSPLQRSVVDLIVAEAPSRLAPALADDGRTFWERLADNVTRVGGSWSFIAGFGASLAVWMVGARPWRFRALLWLDAVGLAAYGVFGAAKAELFGVAPLICIVMGALTACFGGIVRDLLAGQPSILLRREITVSAALLAATIYVAARALGLEAWPAALLASACGFALRAGALVWGWSLPAFPGSAARG